MSAKSVIETAEDVRGGRISAVDVAQGAIERAARDDVEVNSFVALNAEATLDAARLVDAKLAQGEDPGLLAGVPIGVKDNEHCTGFPTRFGSLMHLKDPPQTVDSEHVARLRAAGAVPLGKVAMGEFGLDAVTYTLAHGVCRNPWNLARTPGGSSGGSAAAVAAGIVPLCTGSDALGSIRAPAAFTGLIGLKPSLGRIPRAHGFRDTSALGPLTMTVADAARYLDVVSGPSNRDRMSLPAPSMGYEQAIETFDVTGLRAAWSPDLGFAPVEAEVLELCEAAFRRLVRAARLKIARAPAFINVYPEWNALCALELIGDFERAGVLPNHRDRISPGPASFIDSAINLSLAQQAEYRGRIRALEAQVAEFFEDADVLFCPTTGCPAYAAEGPLPIVIAGRDASKTNAEPFTALGSICWNPSISLPVGVTRDGLPVGLLLTGPRHRDEVVLRLARIWEQTAPWPRVAPAFAPKDSVAA